MASPTDTKTLTAACHCRNVHFNVTIPAASLPLDVHLCHCSLCRYTHGTFCTFHANLPEGIEPEFIAPSSMSNLTPYTHPQGHSTGYFCSTCGCNIGCQDSVWVISSAIFDANCDESIWKINEHIFASSAPSGDLARLLTRVGAHQLHVSHDPATISSKRQTTTNDSANEILRAECHCGGVFVDIARPRKEFTEDPANSDWVPPGEEQKWRGVIEVCDDCRLVNGVNLAGWIFVPTDHMSPRPGENLALGTSKAYQSSEGVLRSFCGRCGATVFYSCIDRPHVFDVSVGILRAPEGVMATTWAAWKMANIGREDGRRYDAEFTKALIEGVEGWVEKNGQATVDKVEN